jgi:uncharacterized integral membrane protein
VEEGVSAGRGRPSWRFWGAAAAIILTVVFIAVNSQEVTVDFIVGDAELPLIFALLLATGLGFVIGLALPRLRRRD